MNYCRQCDLFTGYGGAGVCVPPEGKDDLWLMTCCWGCGGLGEPHSREPWFAPGGVIAEPV
jgi:hypothetical protein